ncbi:unnamed protein product, partial [marine sediment metagenome]
LTEPSLLTQSHVTHEIPSALKDIFPGIQIPMLDIDPTRELFKSV